jgi:predicted O-linked N-acetylglucosamine transferase (SPINDLY family)
MTDARVDDAIAAFQAGDGERASALLQPILAGGAPPAAALHLAGHMALVRGDVPGGIALLTRAAAAAPDHKVVANDLGVGFRLAGRLGEAEAAFARAAALDAGYAEAWHNLGLTRRALGQLAPAAEALTRAIAIAPAPLTLLALGVVRLALGDAEAAAMSLTHATQLAPEMAEAWFNLGLARYRLGAATLGPDGAEAAFARAAALKPDWAEPHDALGAAHAQRGDDQGARAALERAAALAPGNPRIAANLANALLRDDNARALALLERASAGDPANAETLFTLGIARHNAGDIAGARAAWRGTLERDARHARARSALLMDAHYDDDATGAQLLAAAREWGRAHGDPPGRTVSWPNPRDPDRRLRIGYVSPDFRDHSVAQFVAPLLAAHDRAQVEIFAYASVRRPDAVTAALRARTDRWRDIVHLSDQQAAALVRDDAIDILVDLAGHTAEHRLHALALHPAPLQMTWLGYPGTTGLAAIGWRISDAIADPPGAIDTTETVIRLPTFLCYGAPAAPPVAQRHAGPVTFGCFNNARKLTPRMLAVWARILAGAPDARLILKAKGLAQPAIASPIRAAFGGIAARVELRDYVDDTQAHLASYGEIDIALDTFPYCGTTTTCEALWMGVPVVTLAGDRHSARVGASLLTAAGLGELIAHDREDYVARALALAADAPRRAALRAGMRARLAAAPLMDARGFARSLEAAYRDAWRAWCTAGK